VPAVGAEADRAQRWAVVQDALFLPRGEVVNTHQAIFPRRGQQAAVGAERDPQDGVSVGLRLILAVSFLHAVEADALADRRQRLTVERREYLTVGAESQAINTLNFPGTKCLACGEVPQLDTAAVR
jgi:hypothetical protein